MGKKNVGNKGCFIMPNINWQAVLEQLSIELPQLHKNLFFNHQKEKFYSTISALKERIETMLNYTILDKVL